VSRERPALAEDLEHWLKHEPIRARHTGIFTRGEKWVRRKPAIAALIAALIALAAIMGWNVWQSELISSPPAKSVAVLPFSNLGKEEENAYFADGVKDQILTYLAKIADLKVISRTSVMQYKSGGARNLREIGQQLRVANVLEGSVQRAGNRVRVNAQLVDARSDQHLWAQTYDRDLADVFAIQSEIAQAIAAQLQAKISERERAAIAQPPTSDLVANGLYVQARELEYNFSHQSMLEAVRLLNEAVTRDPYFLLAYCMLGEVHLHMFQMYDHTPARRELGNVAIQNAVRLQPDAGEVHSALANYAYWGFLDYDRARAELDLARRTLPNDPEIYDITGLIDRRQGRWTEAIRNFERAVELDPRNLQFLWDTALTYACLRRYSESSELLDRLVALSPSNWRARLYRAGLPFRERADVRPRRRSSPRFWRNNRRPRRILLLLLPCGIAQCSSAILPLSMAPSPPYQPRDFHRYHRAVATLSTRANSTPGLRLVRLTMRLRRRPPSALLGRLLKRPSVINRTTKPPGAFSAKSTPVTDAKMKPCAKAVGLANSCRYPGMRF